MSFSMLVKPVPELMICPSASAVLMAEACNIGLEPLIRSNVPALTRHRLNWTKANYLRAETITSANARLVDFQATLPLAQIWVEEKWHLQMECALLRQSEQSMPDRTANTLVITEDHRYNFVSDQYSGFHGIVIPGTLRTLSLCWKVFWNRRPG